MLERHLQSKILTYLEAQPHTHAIKAIITNHRGTPDVLICHKGHFIYLEIKSPTRPSRPTPLQHYIISKLRSAGARGFTTNSYEHFLETYNALIRSL